ncbi:MAG: DUF721 domain-containing protein [Luteimonas sp.]
MSGSRSSGGDRGTGCSPGPKAALEALLSGTSADPIRRALWLDALDQRLRPCLPPSLAAHARLANVVGTKSATGAGLAGVKLAGLKLVFLVDSPVWHARLRLATPELLDAARSIGLDATEVVVRTCSQVPEPGRAAPLAPKPMSAAAREALDAALSSLSPAIPAGPEPARGADPESPDPSPGTSVARKGDAC